MVCKELSFKSRRESNINESLNINEIWFRYVFKKYFPYIDNSFSQKATTIVSSTTSLLIPPIHFKLSSTFVNQLFDHLLTDFGSSIGLSLAGFRNNVCCWVKFTVASRLDETEEFTVGVEVANALAFGYSCYPGMASDQVARVSWEAIGAIDKVWNEQNSWQFRRSLTWIPPFISTADVLPFSKKRETYLVPEICGEI